MHDHLAEYGCSVEKGTELLQFDQFEDRVEARLRVRGVDGTGTVEEKKSFEWVIGTDGARGVVRKLLGLSFLGETRNIENFVVGDIKVNGLSRDVSVLPFYVLSRGACAHRVYSIGICGETLDLYCKFHLSFASTE